MACVPRDSGVTDKDAGEQLMSMRNKRRVHLQHTWSRTERSPVFEDVINNARGRRGKSRRRPPRKGSASLKRGSRCAQHLVERGEVKRDAK
jgi:hypothetical protein